MTTQLAKARRAARKAALALRERNDAIQAAHQAGSTIRSIAEATELSPARIHQILHGK